MDLSSVPPGQTGIDKLLSYVTTDQSSDAESLKNKEQAVGMLVDLFVKAQNAQGLANLLSQLRSFFNTIPKAKTAKLVRNIIDSIAKIPGSTALQVQVCKEQVEWAKSEKRAFLRQRIELRLATLYLESKNFQEALQLISSLLSEVKKLDDKLLLVDIHLLESRASWEPALSFYLDTRSLRLLRWYTWCAVHHLLRNLPKSRAALTAARTAANAIYVPVQLQAEIDCQSGTLTAEEKDYKTAYSYFFEGFEQYSALNEPKAVQLLKYMLLCKIMLNESGDVPAIISGKAGLKYQGREVEAMKSVAKASQDRSLAAFQTVLTDYRTELVDDPLINSHLSALYDTLLEQNLIRLIEPFSRVEIGHIAELINLPLQQVEAKLSQMILDKKILGTLDQGGGCLEVFEERKSDAVYPTALEVFDSMGRVVDTLFARSQKIVAV